MRARIEFCASWGVPLPKTDKPLAGKRIVVTRAPEQSAEFIGQLESLGAEVLSLPTITITEAENPAELNRAVSELDKFDWVIFTSRNAVKFLVRRMAALPISSDRANQLMVSPEVAVIGAATSAEALAAGFLSSYEGRESRGEVLGTELLEKVRGKRVLMPRGDRADQTLPRLLRDGGAQVAEVIAYRTVAPQSFDMKTVEAIRAGDVDAITFFSPSAYDNFVDEIGLETLDRQSRKIAIATIGPTTSKAVRRDDLPVAIEAPNASAASLCAAIADYFELRATRGMASR